MQFHGVIGYDTGASLGANDRVSSKKSSTDAEYSCSALLAQSLFSFPLSAASIFPSFYPQLPKGVKRLPRMGGWEEEPPPPNDPRLGSENLTKEYVPAQRPFELVISLRSTSSSTSDTLGATAMDWMKKHPPLLSTQSGDSFAVHSITIAAGTHSSDVAEIEHVCNSTEDLFDSKIMHLLTRWIELAIASCQGDSSATKQISSLDITAKL